VSEIKFLAKREKLEAHQLRNTGLDQRFSTDGSWYIFNGSWKFLRNNINVCKSALIDKNLIKTSLNLLF
jgi:hypothetical protein